MSASYSGGQSSQSWNFMSCFPKKIFLKIPGCPGSALMGLRVTAPNEGLFPVPKGQGTKRWQVVVKEEHSHCSVQEGRLTDSALFPSERLGSGVSAQVLRPLPCPRYRIILSERSRSAPRVWQGPELLLTPAGFTPWFLRVTVLHGQESACV